LEVITMKTRIRIILMTLAVTSLAVAAVFESAADTGDVRVSRYVISAAATEGSSADYKVLGTVGEAAIGINTFSIGAMWDVDARQLFHDNFPSDGSLTGWVRMDMAQDILPPWELSIQPGDSLAIGMSAQQGLLQGFWPRLQTPPHEGVLGTDSLYGGAAIYMLVRSSGGHTGTEISGDPVRWPVIEVEDGWTTILMDTAYTDTMGVNPVVGKYCVDLNDGLFAPPDSVKFYFSAIDTGGQVTYWSERCGSVENETEVRSQAMEVQCLPTGNSEILYVEASGDEGQAYFEIAFEILGITPDRYDVREPSSYAGNSLASRASHDQLTGAYRTIIWSTGSVDSGTVGDGTGNPRKEDDFDLLSYFLDTNAASSRAGVYFSGDDLAEEWMHLAGASAVDFRNVWMPYALIDGDHRSGHPGSPLCIGESGSMFDHASGVDTLIAFGDGPTPSDFDVISPQSSSELQMTYEGTGSPNDGCVLANTEANSVGNLASVVLSGFSFHSIRDDRTTMLPDHIHHLLDILRFLEWNLDDPTGVAEAVEYVNSLAHNYPNPFNPTTTIRFSLRERVHVSLTIYNVRGQRVRTLVDEERGPGVYTERWDGVGNQGDPVASGVYFCRMVTKGFASTRKLVIVK
jgi:hypothetical protein